MSTVSDALKSARTLLSDDLGLNWTDQILIPKFVQAHNEMIAKLVLNGLKPTRKDLASVTITAGSLSMGGNQPTDLDQPIKITEMAVNDIITNSVPMQECDFLPENQQAETLKYWTFNGGVIRFLGATQDRVVHLYYQAIIISPTKATETLQIPLSETFLGPRIAAMCVAKSDKDLAKIAFQMAEENLSMIVRTAVKSDQLPVRRRPFSYSLRSRRRHGI